MQPAANIAITLAKATPQRQRKPILLFSLVKNFSSFLPCEKNHLTNQNLCSLLQINFIFKFSLEKISVRILIISPVYTHISKTLVLRTDGNSFLGLHGHHVCNGEPPGKAGT